MNTGGLDGVVCCAGTVAFGPLDETPADVLHAIVAVDLVGPLMLARAAIPVLPRGGFILNVSGVIAEIPTAGLVPYSAAKGGISAGFRALAREVRPRGVSVIDARPPHTETGLPGRALRGEPPRMREGLDPTVVAERLVRGSKTTNETYPRALSRRDTRLQSLPRAAGRAGSGSFPPSDGCACSETSIAWLATRQA